MGEDTDRLVLGLAIAGLAVTAATYVSVGGGRRYAPADAGQGCPQVGGWAKGSRHGQADSAREMVDAPMLQNRVASGSVMRPGQIPDGDKSGVPRRKGRRAGASRQGRGRIGERAGTRGALDTLRVARVRRNIARAARLAEFRGARPARPQTAWPWRTAAAAGAFDLTLWCSAR